MGSRTKEVNNSRTKGLKNSKSKDLTYSKSKDLTNNKQKDLSDVYNDIGLTVDQKKQLHFMVSYIYCENKHINLNAN